MLFCFTDGLADIQNAEGVYFEETKVREFVLANQQLKAAEFNKKLIAEIEEFKGEQEYVDDIAMITTNIY